MREYSTSKSQMKFHHGLLFLEMKNNFQTQKVTSVCYVFFLKETDHKDKFNFFF